MKTKVCLVGVSGFGRVHYRDVVRGVEAGRLEIVGATVINQDEETEKVNILRSLGCRVYDVFEDMLSMHASEADLCLLPVGIPLHKSMTIAAVTAGLNVLVEKPAAGVIQDVLEMEEAARNAGRLVAVAFQHHYDPGTLKAKRLLLDGAAGRVERVKCRACWPRTQSYYDRNGWAGRLKTGGKWVLDSPFNNALSHELALMLFLIGGSERESAQAVKVQAELYHAYDIETADTAAIRFQTDAGPEVLFAASHACREETESFIRIEGSKGRLDWTRKGWQLRDQSGTHMASWETPANLRDIILESVTGAICGSDDFYCSLALAAAQTRAVNACHEAGPIHTVGSDYTEHHDGRRVIKDIDRAILDCFEQFELFSELGLPWAVKALEWKVPTDYCRFPDVPDGK